jgi:xylulokinase
MLNEKYRDEIFKTAYQMPAPTWTLPQLMWLKKNEPENFGKIKTISFVKDYVRFLLTGVLKCDYIEAQGTLLWDMENSCWSKELCTLAGISVDALPQIGAPTDLAGEITSKGATDTGLEESTVVVMGTSDSAVEGYAAGAVRPGQCILKLATAGNVNVMTQTAHPDSSTLTYSHVVPGMWYTVTATNAAAICQRWFRDNFYSAEFAQAEADNKNIYEIINSDAEKSPAGANGVFFHPYLMGERSPYWDSNLRASFTGMSMNTTRADLSRALLEGVAFSLKDCFRTIERMGLEVKEFILIGGGAKGRIWSQIVADVFDATVICPAECDASFGSALLAGVGIGVFENEISAVEACLKIDRKITPDKDNAKFYAEKFANYRRLHDLLAEAYGGFSSHS